MDSKTLKVVAGIIGAAIFLGLLVHGAELASRGTADSITVTGSSKRRVEADLAKWNASFTRRTGAYDLKAGITRSAADIEAIKKFVTDHGIPADAIIVTPVQTGSMYEYSNYGVTNNLIGYNVTQSIRVESTDVDAVEKLGKDFSKLIDQGIIADYQNTEYFYTKITDLRPELFAEATKDAQVRAEAIAKGTSAKVGKLKSARTGVVQILPPNSLEVADYGAYDTSTRQKEVTATVSVSFELK